MLTMQEAERQWSRQMRGCKGAAIRRAEYEATRLNLLKQLKDQPGGMEALNGMAKNDAELARLSVHERRRRLAEANAPEPME